MPRVSNNNAHGGRGGRRGRGLRGGAPTGVSATRGAGGGGRSLRSSMSLDMDRPEVKSVNNDCDEDSESGKSFQKKLHKQLFIEDLTNNSDIRSPVKKRIKHEPESDVELTNNNNNPANDTQMDVDENYLNLKVKEEISPTMSNSNEEEKETKCIIEDMFSAEETIVEERQHKKLKTEPVIEASAEEDETDCKSNQKRIKLSELIMFEDDTFFGADIRNSETDHRHSDTDSFNSEVYRNNDKRTTSLNIKTMLRVNNKRGGRRGRRRDDEDARGGASGGAGAGGGVTRGDRGRGRVLRSSGPTVPRDIRPVSAASPASHRATSASSPTPNIIFSVPSLAESDGQHRLAYNVEDPRLLDVVADVSNGGSDEDSDPDDEGEISAMQCSRLERDFFTEDTAPGHHTTTNYHRHILSTEQQSPVVVDPLPSTSASIVRRERSSALVSLTGATYSPHFLDEFEWEALPQPPKQRQETFMGSVGPVSAFPTPYDAFVSIWDRSFMDAIAAETNRYAEQTLAVALSRGNLGGYSRMLFFHDTDADELYVFFSLIIATGIVVKTHLPEYWSVVGDVIDTPNFGRFMSRNRFFALSRMLHFVNNELDIRHLSRGEQKVAKIAPVIQHLNEKFQALYQLGKCIALDESLTQWKGWQNINQFIKNKVTERDVKTYDVCDSKSGYLWRFTMHTGQNNQTYELGYITSLVLDLLRGLENKGHTIFMDNYYNSPLLARILKSQGFDCVGTLRLNRQNVPADLKNLTKRTVSPGSVFGATCGDVDIMVWRDRKIVSLVSTYHGLTSSSRDGKVKPTLVHDYNIGMGGIDKKDQMMSTYPVERKGTMVWYKKIFRRLLNISVFNAYILHRESPIPQHPHTLITKHRHFRKTLIQQILAKHGQEREPTLLPPKLNPAAKVKFTREITAHFPKEFPFYANQKQRKRGTCSCCRRRTHIRCDGCNVALCLEPCFVNFHS